jgi:hypothetical protein
MYTYNFPKALPAAVPSRKLKNKRREDPTLGIASPAWSHCPFSPKTRKPDSLMKHESKTRKAPTQCNDISLFLHAAGYPTSEGTKEKKRKEKK